MAGFGSTFCNDLLKLILQAVAIANLADNAASGPLASLYASLHTASPGSGNQTTSEATYGSYARVAHDRDSNEGDSDGWAVAANVATLLAAITFPTSTGTPSETLTHFAIGTASTSTGKVLFYGTITPNITMNAAGITPQLTTSTTITLT